MSLVSLDTALPQSPADPDPLHAAQSPGSPASGSHAGRLRDASNQQLPAGSALIKAGVRAAPSKGDEDTVEGINQNKGTGRSHRVAFDQSAGVLTLAENQSKALAEDWMVIQSDGSDSEFASKPGAKPGLVRVKSEVPQAELPLQQQGLLQPGSPISKPQRSVSNGAKLHSGHSIQLLKRKLPALKVPLTGMGQPRAAGRVAMPRYVAEGFGLSGNTCPDNQAMSASCSHSQSVLDIFLQAQPDQCQEEQAACALRQHLSNNLSQAGRSCVAAPQQLLCIEASLVPGYASVTQHSQSGWSNPQPVAEGRESIAAFHPSWHLRLNQTARSQPQPEQQSTAIGQEDDNEESLDLFYRPAAVAVKPPQHQPSMVEEAGCLNFGSHLVSQEQLPEKHPPRQASQTRQRSAIDDAALSSEEEGSEYEEGAGSESLSHAESVSQWWDESDLPRDRDDPRNSEAGVKHSDAVSEQGRFQEGQYADYHSEEGLSEEEQYPEPNIDREGLDHVLPAGITTNTEVYSPMSHGATRVRSMITNRPFLIEEPVSPVAKRLGDTIRIGSQVTFDAQADTLYDTAPMQPPTTQEEPLYHDWSQPSASFLAAANAEAAAAAEAEAAEAAAAEEEAQQAAVRKPLSDPNTVKAPKAGAVTRLTDTLFRRSGKRTAETQTTEYREEETQTSEQDESQQQAGSQQIGLISGASC